MAKVPSGTQARQTARNTAILAAKIFYCEFCDVAHGCQLDLDRYTNAKNHKMKVSGTAVSEWTLRDRARVPRYIKEKKFYCALGQHPVGSNVELKSHMKGPRHLAALKNEQS